MHADAMAELARALRDVINLETSGVLSAEAAQRLLEARALLRVAEIVAVQSFTTAVWLEKKAQQAGAGL